MSLNFRGGDLYPPRTLNFDLRSWYIDSITRRHTGYICSKNETNPLNRLEGVCGYKHTQTHTHTQNDTHTHTHTQKLRKLEYRITLAYATKFPLDKSLICWFYNVWRFIAIYNLCFGIWWFIKFLKTKKKKWKSKFL